MSLSSRTSQQSSQEVGFPMFTLQMVLGYEMQSQALEMGITKHPTI